MDSLENINLNSVKNAIYDPLSLEISQLIIESEGKAYYTCVFQLNHKRIISRSSKITPKKTGQFVTFWKRNENGIAAPFS